MLLTVSIGNTNCAFGLFDRGTLNRHGTVANRELATLPEVIGDIRINQIALASVAPAYTEQAIPLLAGAFRQSVLLAGRDLPFTLDIQCDEPDNVGVDRLLNAIAAYERTQSAAIVVDVGTAITIDLVSDRGTFRGGAIATGPATMLRALTQNAEQLPAVSLDQPPDPIGHTTTDAMRSGAWYGTIGLVRELITRIGAEQGGTLPVLLTGGAGQFVASELTPPAEYLPHLTLEGLALLLAQTQSNSA